MNTVSGVVAALLALSSCAQEPKPERTRQGVAVAPNTTSPTPPTEVGIAGIWRIVTINGAPPKFAGPDADSRRTPRLVFLEAHYTGTVGCNAFGGMGMFEGDRFYTSPGGQTVMGCGDLIDQEMAATSLMFDGPRVSIGADGGMILTGTDKTMTLRRDLALAKAVEGLAVGTRGGLRGKDVSGPGDLAGTNFHIYRMDGRYLSPRSQTDRRPLRFTNGRWSGRVACATLSGGWRQRGDRIVLTGATTTTEQLCPPAEAAVDAALAQVMAANPRFVRGSQGYGEILIAGGGHWLVAGEDQRFRQP